MKNTKNHARLSNFGHCMGKIIRFESLFSPFAETLH